VCGCLKLSELLLVTRLVDRVCDLPTSASLSRPCGSNTGRRRPTGGAPAFRFRRIKSRTRRLRLGGRGMAYGSPSTPKSGDTPLCSRGRLEELHAVRLFAHQVEHAHRPTTCARTMRTALRRSLARDKSPHPPRPLIAANPGQRGARQESSLLDPIGTLGAQDGRAPGSSSTRTTSLEWRDPRQRSPLIGDRESGPRRARRTGGPAARRSTCRSAPGPCAAGRTGGCGAGPRPRARAAGRRRGRALPAS
jgi:hypothetical protein